MAITRCSVESTLRCRAEVFVELVRIRTLAAAGVPLARVRELLSAGPEEFAAAVEDIDRRLRADIREKQHHREQIAQLAAGNNLALPPAAVAHFDRMRDLGFAARMIEVEQESWVLIAARMPQEVPALMAMKRQQIDDDELLKLLRGLGEVLDCHPDDPRLADVADRFVAFIEAEAVQADGVEEEYPLSDELVELLDSVFLESFPCAPRLLELLEERGWTGWTMIERMDRDMCR